MEDDELTEDDPFGYDEEENEDPFADDVVDEEDPFGGAEDDPFAIDEGEEFKEDENEDNITAMFVKYFKVQDDVSEAIRRKIERVKERFDVTGRMSLSYLYKTNWGNIDVDGDVDLYGDLGMDYDQEESGVPEPDSSKTFTCESCYDDELKASEMAAMPCGHFFCKDCWKKSLKIALDLDGTSVLSMTCLHSKCKRVVTVDDVFRFLDSEHELSRYSQKVVDSYMNHNQKTFQWCPQSSCNSIVAAPLHSSSETMTHVQCKQCNESFCFECREMWNKNQAKVEDHRPCPCDYVKRWQDVRSETGFKSYITMALKAGLIKSCPRCDTPVEKISERGCLHMTCRNCKCEYCWECLATPYHTFGTSGFYVCPNVKKRKHNETLDDLKTQINTGDEQNATARVERYRIAQEHFDRADASSNALKRDLKFHVERLRKNLEKEADLTLGMTLFLEDTRKELLRGTIMLKWIAVFTYFDYEFDATDRHFELNMLRIRQNDLVRNLKLMFNRITFRFPFEEIVKEQKRVDCVSEDIFDGFRDSLRHLRRDAKTARENLCRQIQEYFPEIQNSRNEDESYWKRRETQWRRAKIWLQSSSLTEFGSRKRDMEDEKKCLERAEHDRKRKKLFRPDWLAKLIHVENKFPHRPWMLKMPSLEISNSLKRVVKESLEKSKIQQYPFWWWSADGNFYPFDKGTSDVVEKAYLRWCTDRDELNFDHQMTRFFKMQKKSKEVETKVDEETEGSILKTTEICRYYNTKNGCKYGSRCKHLHVKIAKLDDDVENDLNDVVVSGSLPISLSDLTVKVKIDFEKIVMNSAMSVGLRRFDAIDLLSQKSVHVERRVSKKSCWNCPCGNWIPNEHKTCPISGHPISSAST